MFTRGKDSTQFMRPFRCFPYRLCLIFSSAICGFFPGRVDGDMLALQDRLVEVFRESNEAVVQVKAASFVEGDSSESRRSLRVGSGFFISADGHLLTNASVVRNAERIWIEHRGISHDARLIGLDERSNISLLRLENPVGRFDFIPLGRSGVPEIGTFVVAIACALDFEPAPSLGVVSGHETHFGERVFPTLYLRTTLPANPGEGGAPVLDISGRFVGMIVASLPEVQSSYVIPSQAVARIRDDLLLGGRVEHGWIGVELEYRLSPEGERQLVFSEVVKNSPAERADLRVGDRLVALNGEELEDIRKLWHDFFLIRVGEVLALEIEREEERKRVAVRVEARKKDSNGF